MELTALPETVSTFFVAVYGSKRFVLGLNYGSSEIFVGLVVQYLACLATTCSVSLFV